MSTSPANGSALSFPKTLVGLSSTASFTINNSSTTKPGPPPTLGGGGFTGSFPAASAPFSPKTSQAFQTKSPSGYTNPTPYSYLLAPAVVAADGGQSSISRVYTFTPTVRGTKSEPITFKPTTGYVIPSSTVTLTGQGVAPVISLDSSSGSLGNVRIGTTGTASLSVVNIGDGNQAGAGLGNLTGTVGAGSGGFSGSGGSFNLGDSGSQSFSYTVTPTNHGALSSTISVTTTDGSADGTNSAQTLLAALSATGVGPVLSTNLVPNSTLSFVSPQAPAETLTIANVTTDANLGALTNLDVISATLSGSGASMFSLSGLNAGTILTKSQSANLQVSFVPQSGASGAESATLTLVTDEGAANGARGETLSFALAGTAATTTTGFYWKGGHGGAWNTTSPGFNWTIANGSSTEVTSLPTASSDIFFTLANPGTTNTTLGQNMLVRSITFAATSAPMTIGGSNTLTIAAGITEASGGTATQTISAPVQLGATQTWEIDGSGPLIVSGPISGSAALVKSGAGTLVLAGSVGYTGGTSVEGGTLILASANTIPAGMPLTVDAGDTWRFDPSVTASPVAASSVAAAVPEPSTIALLGATPVGWIVYRWRRRKKAATAPAVKQINASPTRERGILADQRHPQAGTRSAPASGFREFISCQGNTASRKTCHAGLSEHV